SNNRMSTFMDINMAMRPVNAMFRKGVMFISSDEVIRVRKGSGDINGDEWRPESNVLIITTNPPKNCVESGNTTVKYMHINIVIYLVKDISQSLKKALPGQPMDLDENEETEHQHEPAEDRVEESSDSANKKRVNEDTDKSAKKSSCKKAK
ncbi:6477_t:CDS:2, partial [Paraglomus brasilianum]